MRRSAAISTVVLLSVLLVGPQRTFAAETLVSGAGEGLYPVGTTFNSLSISGLQFSLGLEFSDIGDKVGHLTVVLLGTSALGVKQQITIEGEVTGGTRMAANVAVFSGTCSINAANGAPSTLNVPFSATVTTDANGKGTIGLVIGATTLPTAMVSVGSMTVD